MPAVLLGQDDITENPRPGIIPNPDADAPTHKTAFMVLVTHDGHYFFEPDINKPITIERLPTASEVKGTLASLLGEIQSQEAAVTTAQLVLGNLQMQARQAFDAQQNQQVLQKIGMK